MTFDFANLSDIISHSFFPCRCPSCDRVVLRSRLFCENCISDIHKYQTQFIKTESTEQIFFTAAIAPFEYSGAIRNALITLKIFKNKRLISYLAKSIANAIKLSFDDVFFDAVCCVPMYSGKQKKIGFNHSEELAKAVALELNIKYAPLLSQKSQKTAQHMLTELERWQSVKGKYEAKQNGYDTVLLIDDIITTGATMNECAKMLKAAGTIEIYCAGVAKNSK